MIILIYKVIVADLGIPEGYGPITIYVKIVTFDGLFSWTNSFEFTLLGLDCSPLLTPVAQVPTPSKIYYHILTTGRMTWQESFDHAIAHNSKLPTLAEAKEIIR